MRICHVVESAGAGTGQVVSDLARLQKEAGHDVTVIYSPDRAEQPFLSAINAIDGLHILQASMRRSVGLHDLFDAWRLYHLIRQAGPFDILHGHSSKAGALSRLVGLFLPATKIVYTPHAFVTMGKDTSALYCILEHWLSFLADAIIATSQMEKEHGVQFLKINPKKLHVVPNGIKLGHPANREDARRKLGINPDTKLMGFVGRLAKQKNIPRLLEVYRLCSEFEPTLRLIILGDGEEKAATAQAIELQGWSEQIQIVSGLSARDLFPAFDVFVNSSDYESFGLTLVEAMDARVPVVTTPVGIAPDLIIDGETGFIGTFEASTLADGVKKILSLTNEEKQKLCEAAAERTKIFSDVKAAQNTMEVYRGG